MGTLSTNLVIYNTRDAQINVGLFSTCVQLNNYPVIGSYICTNEYPYLSNVLRLCASNGRSFLIPIRGYSSLSILRIFPIKPNVKNSSTNHH
ncbi:hypothetical protein HZS_6075 [Henneguya salminicola]|nr:hypothetical protein HZS_6075 [Henneguya salminicola]